MNKGLYTRLAFTNMKKNGQFYIPYLITGIITVAMFYIMCALNGNPGWDGKSGSADIKAILVLGSIVIAIFSVIFIFYTNSFIIKRRKKELGVYNILGMEKKHLAKVLFLETLFTAIAAIGGGLLTGVLFNKLMCMLLFHLMGFDAGIGFYVSVSGVSLTVALFAAIYFLTLLYDMLQIKLANPIELLHGSNVGEREPKTKILLALIGFVCIGIGYYMAITTESPLKALMLFFVAVLLVIVGTYCLFTAGSIALLKILRKNKNYYYKARHFTAVSGMLYRMKQNAVGLANICILSTMVLIMVSTTVSMYLGVEDELDNRFTSDITVTANFDDEISGEDTILDTTNQTVKDSGRTIGNESSYSYLPIGCAQDGNSFDFTKSLRSSDYDSITYLCVMTRDSYEAMTDEQLPEIGQHEAVLVTQDKCDMSSFSLGGQEYTVKDTKTTISRGDQYMADMMSGFYYIVVNDKASLDEIYQLQKSAYGENSSSYTYNVQIDIDGSKSEKIACGEAVSKAMDGMSGSYKSIYSECRDAYSDNFHHLYGGLFFLGLFLGTMFLMITVLIIFYKQISEGYDDKERFAIMEKVGMSSAEVKATISSQVKIVFFLPIVTAAIHVAAAFPMVRRLLAVLNLTNTALFAGCLAGTIVVFAVIYLIVFLLTSKTYYKIVGEQV